MCWGILRSFNSAANGAGSLVCGFGISLPDGDRIVGFKNIDIKFIRSDDTSAPAPAVALLCLLGAPGHLGARDAETGEPGAGAELFGAGAELFGA
jgi:hypothetical protein